MEDESIDVFFTRFHILHSDESARCECEEVEVHVRFASNLQALPDVLQGRSGEGRVTCVDVLKTEWDGPHPARRTTKVARELDVVRSGNNRSSSGGSGRLRLSLVDDFNRL